MSHFNLKRLFLILATALFVVDWYFFAVKESWMIYDVFIRIGIYILALILAISGLIRTIKKPDRTTIILAIIGTVIVIGLYKFVDQPQDPILAAHYDGDINGLTFQFFEDGTYKLHDYAIFGGDMIKGTFELVGDTITLADQYPLGENRDFLTNKLLVGDSTIVVINSEGEAQWPIFRITLR